jgi:hypothetical protein
VLAAAQEHVWFWQTPSWNWAEIWALVVLLAITFFPVRVPTKRRERNGGGGATKWAALFASLVNGKDGRWSTSKTSTVLWTYAVWFAFLTILLHTNGKDLEHAIVKQQYLVLLGVPVATAVIAKGLTQSKVESGKVVTKAPDGTETNVAAGVGQLVADDTGQPALLDFQYFGFNLLLLAYFLVRFLGDQAAGLPDLPDSLVALTGVSAAGYVAKKGLSDDTTTPVITSIDPPAAAPGETITIRGPNLATPTQQQDVRVHIGNVSTQPSGPISFGERYARIPAVVPSGVPEGDVSVVVINYEGATTNPHSFKINAPPASPDG